MINEVFGEWIIELIQIVSFKYEHFFPTTNSASALEILTKVIFV